LLKNRSRVRRSVHHAIVPSHCLRLRTCQSCIITSA